MLSHLVIEDDPTATYGILFQTGWTVSARLHEEQRPPGCTPGGCTRISPLHKVLGILSLVEKFTGHLESHVDQIQAIRQRLGKSKR